MEIRKNLYQALRSLRDVPSHSNDARERVLWADAICINQNDLEERNQQVSIMAFIYSRAQTVLV
jgi:hypothetical protein